MEVLPQNDVIRRTEFSFIPFVRIHLHQASNSNCDEHTLYVEETAFKVHNLKIVPCDCSLQEDNRQPPLPFRTGGLRALILQKQLS